MSDINDWFVSQVVTADEMDTIYDDLNAVEQGLAGDAGAEQAAAASAAIYGGILSGLVVTKVDATTVQVTLGAARDSSGQKIDLAANATVSLLNLGDTPEGDTTTATGDGSLTASAISAGEAWLALFIVYDTNLSDLRVDGLGNSVYFRQTESFHFRLEVGTDAAVGTATSRPGLDAAKVLLTDILLDNNGEIRVITAIDAIAGTSGEMNEIGYGLEDTPDLTGRRSDCLAIDADADAAIFQLWKEASDTSKANNKAFVNLRAGTPREMIYQLALLYHTQGSATGFAGSELLGGKAVSGKALSSPGSAVALQMPATSSIHAQLEALYDKVNTLLSRGSDTLTGNLVVTGSISSPVWKISPATGDDGLWLDANTNNLDLDATNDILGKVEDPEGNLPIIFEPYGRIAEPHLFKDDFNWHPLAWPAGTPVDLYYTEQAVGANSQSEVPAVPAIGTVGGGVLELTAGNVSTNNVAVYGSPKISLYQGGSGFTAPRLARFMARYAPTALTKRTDEVGILDGVQARINFWFDPDVGAAWRGEVFDGTNTKTVTLTGSDPSGTAWQNLYFAVIDTTDVAFWVTGMSAPIVMTIGGGGEPVAFDQAYWGSYAPALYVKLTTNEGADKVAVMDFWSLWDNKALSGAQ